MSTCTGCGAEIVWTLTERGKQMPLDSTPQKRVVIVTGIVADGKILADPALPPGAEAGRGAMVDTYLPHWASCPKAEQFKKARATA